MTVVDTASFDRSSRLTGLLNIRALWIVLAVLGALVLNMSGDPLLTARSLTDPDNATRLVQVNTLLNGAGWYDLRLNQIGLPDGLISHWSRVVDAPLAILFSIERMVTGDPTADTITRYVWPVLLMCVMFGLAARETERIGGQRAAMLLLFLAATSTFATFQFAPGRIDHHNLQIIGAAGGMLALYRALLTGHGAIFAGSLLGFGLVIGYEAMPLTVAVIGVAVLFTTGNTQHLQLLARTLTGLSVTLAAGLAINHPPSSWLTSDCDALDSNLVLFALVGTLTVSIVAFRGQDWTIGQRIAGLAIGCAASIAAYAAPNAACLAGPMAAVDPAIRTIWLAHVTEGMSLMSLGAEQPAVAGTYVSVLAGAFVLILREWSQTRQTADAVAAAAIALAGLYCTIFIKFFPYAVWLALPVYAVGISRLGAFRSIPKRTIHLAAAILISHGTLLTLSSGGLKVWSAAMAAAKPATSRDASQHAAPPETVHCNVRSDTRALRALPPGRIMNGINLGPHIAADTVHRVLVGPYHRLDRQIVAWHTIFSATPDDGVTALQEGPFDYLVLCAQPANKTDKPQSLRAFLSAGGTHPALQPIDLGPTEKPLRAWRILRPTD